MFEVREMPHAAPLRIVVVDDHVAVRRAVCSLLRSQPDFEVTCEAADGLEAIQKAQELRTRRDRVGYQYAGVKRSASSSANTTSRSRE